MAVTGTFSGTGQSSVITGRKIDIAMDFAGAAPLCAVAFCVNLFKT